MAKKTQSSHPVVHKVNYLMRAIAFVEEKLTALENNFLDLQTQLKQPQTQLEKGVQVTGSAEIKRKVSLDLPVEKLVEIYNDIPNLLTAYAITVALTPESYRQETRGKVLLEENRIGNYWVIHTEDRDWLVPNITIKMNLHKVRTVENLFSFVGDTLLDNRHYFLNQPAQVSLQSNGKVWQLEHRGELELVNISLVKEDNYNQDYQRLLALIKKLDDENSELRIVVDEINLRLNTLENNDQR